MTNEYALPDGNSIPIEYYEYIVKVTRNQLANNLEREATNAMISDEYSFNDTAVRAKTYYHAAQLIRGGNIWIDGYTECQKESGKSND